MNLDPAGDEFDAVLLEVRAMEEEVVLNPENKLEILRKYGRAAREQGGERRVRLFVMMANICNARTDMNDKPINVNVSSSQGVVINLGPVQGSINTHVQALMSAGGGQEKVADAIRQISAAISDSALGDAQKKDALELVDAVAVQAKEPPEKRNGGIVKATLGMLPTVIASAKGAMDLWDKFGPIIRAHFGIS